MPNPSLEQRQVIETWNQGMAVMAGAGSGKTTTLVGKCAELLRKKPDARFAAISFTEKSASDLRAKLTAKLRDESPMSGTLQQDPLQGHWVATIHGFCGSILREYPREAGFDGEESMLSESEAQLFWERAIEQVWSDDAQPEVQTALESLLSRESRDSLWALLRRTRDLYCMGILGSLEKQNDPDSKALAQLASFVLDRYDRLKRRRGALDFNDLEIGADRALESAAVREAYQRRFDLVLVDEFQDTNPVQARIILRFVKPDRSNLCVVGDPKQSIYRFRDADVSVFEEFCSKLPVNISLTRNFRSRPGILEFTNTVCEKAFESSGMKYEPLVPVKEAAESQAVLRLDARSPQDLARWIRAEVESGVPLQEMALLLRKIRGNERWLKALISAGIPIAVGSGGLFWEDSRTRELVSFLKWWDEPSNTLSGAAFLRAPWVGIDDRTLDRWNKEDPSWVTPFFSSTHSLAQVLKEYRGKVVRPGELLMALLSDERMEAELGAPALGLWHRVEDLSSRGLDFHAVVTELALAVEERRRERDVPPPRNEGQLSVLTMHGSKGLEFPHVILVDLGRPSRSPNTPTLFWDRERGAYLVRKDSDGERLDDPELDLWKSNERAKELAESKRVFYVALTRAQERLVLVCPELTEKEAQFDPEKVFEKDFWRGWIEASGALREVRTQQLVPTTSDSKEKLDGNDTDPRLSDSKRIARLAPGSFRLFRPRHSVTEWNLLSRCPRAYEWTYIRPRAVPKKEAFSFTIDSPGPGDPGGEDSAIITQRELGTEVHACLESGNYQRLEELERRAGSERFSAARVRSWAETSPYMNQLNAWNELAFEVPVEGQVLVGSMDRVIESDQGLSVIDFKVTRHGKSPAELIEAYRVQMDLYRWAIEKLTGMPVLETVLVNFSDSGVQEVHVPKQGVDVPALARKASEIVGKDEGVPIPSSLCKVCQFSAICDATEL